MLDRPSPRLKAADLLQLARDCGADDCGLARIDDPALAEERPHVARAFPAARTLLSLVKRMHREPVRSPARSVANLEFHSVSHEVDDIARAIVRRLEDNGIAALNPAMAFPMELDDFPSRGWIVSHKRVAEAAGLGRMGIHRSLIHPRFGSFVLLGTVLIGEEVDEASRPLDFSPCLSCKLCVAACPVGAIKPDGYFDFSSCLTHNYQQFMGGFANFVEDIAASRSVAEFRAKSSLAETVSRWQSLSYGPNYNAAYCLAVCPAGEDVIGLYRSDKIAHRQHVLDPLAAKKEPIYVVKGSDAAEHVAKRFPHKRVRFVRSPARPTTIANFLAGVRLAFQRGKAGDLKATYHFIFTGAETAQATLSIANRRLEVKTGLHGPADLVVTADTKTWLKFLGKEISLPRALLTRAIRFRGPARLFLAFGRCFPG